MPLSKTIHDQLCPLPRSSSRVVIYAFSSKQTQIPVHQSYYDLHLFYLKVKVIIGLVNRNLRLLAGKCINDRTRGRSGKGAELIVYCFRKRHLLGSKLHAGYSIPLRFYLGWSAFWGRCQKFVTCLIYYIIWQKGWLLRWGFGVVPAIIYHCNAVPVVYCNVAHEYRPLFGFLSGAHS